MQLKDGKNFKIGLNKDDVPEDMIQGEYSDLLNSRIASSSSQKGAGRIETLQGEVELLINPDTVQTYYGQALGGQFIYDGFAEVQIGTQVWMKKNWDVKSSGSKAYDDDEANVDIYGRLYTWLDAMSDGFCPDGWRIPTEADIDTLLTYLGGYLIAGGKMKEVGESHWDPSNVGASDNYGFRALPGGMFDTLFSLLGAEGLFWIQDESAPKPPVATDATSVGSELFTANWNASDGATGYYLDVSTAINFSSFVGSFHNLDVSNVTQYIVDGLSSATPYYYRLRAYNDIGASDYSNIITVTTTSLPNVYGALYNWYTINGII
jgi:uncharacterized protein (TIGR02145 family)